MVTCFIIDFIDSNINREALLSQTLWKNVRKKNRYANSILLWFRWKSHQQIVSQLRSLIVLVSVSLLLLCTTTEEKTQQQPIFHFFSWRLFEMFRNRITDTRTDAIVWLWLGMVVALVHFLRVHFLLFVSRPFERWRFDSQSQNLLLIKPMRCILSMKWTCSLYASVSVLLHWLAFCNELKNIQWEISMQFSCFTFSSISFYFVSVWIMEIIKFYLHEPHVDWQKCINLAFDASDYKPTRQIWWVPARKGEV